MCGATRAGDLQGRPQLRPQRSHQRRQLTVRRSGARQMAFSGEGLPEAPMLMQQYPATTSFGGAGPSFMSPTVYSPETTPRWGKKGEQKRPVPAKVCTSIVDGLKQVYNSKVKPLEEAFKFGNFFSPLLNDSDFEAKPSVLLLGQYSTGKTTFINDFEAKPSVLLLGQYSTGKTTFIKYLLGRDYPGSHIGPEPTTDRFVVVYHGLEERRWGEWWKGGMLEPGGRLDSAKLKKSGGHKYSYHFSHFFASLTYLANS
ncbi:uncharacterized protein HaLaN_06683 [Haematococcus lacustris]|uniref:Uncharacterized protein n=1 Tax=Haematococcus lacustris TaxID=44745 RepID=A0A699YVY6_HAELA|nr:uncharacterized protein HaLaN_06683 [Haematococcus lacustris]